VKRGYHRAIGTAIGACITLLVGGCAPPPGQTARPPTGDRRAVSPACQCRFSYPAAWYFRTAIGDTSQPQLALHSYDDANTDHRPVPTRFADIGLDWHPDPGGHLYQALTAPHALSLPRLAEHRAPLVVAGFPAVSYAHWTAPPSEGGIYEQHVYLWAPAYDRDYDLSLMAGNPPGRDVARARAVFTRVLRSLVIGPQPPPRPRHPMEHGRGHAVTRAATP